MQNSTEQIVIQVRPKPKPWGCLNRKHINEDEKSEGTLIAYSSEESKDGDDRIESSPFSRSSLINWCDLESDDEYDLE